MKDKKYINNRTFLDRDKKTQKFGTKDEYISTWVESFEDDGIYLEYGLRLSDGADIISLTGMIYGNNRSEKEKNQAIEELTEHLENVDVMISTLQQYKNGVQQLINDIEELEDDGN